MDYSSEEDLPSDEIAEVKKVLREAKARKKAINAKLSAQAEQINEDKNELQTVIKRQNMEIQKLKETVTESDLELRKARFELGQMVLKESKLNEGQRLLQAESKNVMMDYKIKMEHVQRSHEDKNQYIAKEVNKIIKLIDGVNKTMSEHGGAGSKTSHLMMDVAMKDLSNLKSFLTGGSNQNDNRHYHQLARHSGSLGYDDLSLNREQTEPTVDSSLLDMCRGLEEENHTLLTNMEAIKTQLAAAQQEAEQVKLIPHYRLAIIRSRSYTANLTEQLKREQFTSEQLREQLAVTYEDLKKTVDEKKRLYKKLTKLSLQTDERESFPELSASSRYTPLPTPTSTQQANQQSLSGVMPQYQYAPQTTVTAVPGVYPQNMPNPYVIMPSYSQYQPPPPHSPQQQHFDTKLSPQLPSYQQVPQQQHDPSVPHSQPTQPQQQVYQQPSHQQYLNRYQYEPQQSEQTQSQQLHNQPPPPPSKQQHQHQDDGDLLRSDSQFLRHSQKHNDPKVRQSDITPRTSIEQLLPSSTSNNNDNHNHRQYYHQSAYTQNGYNHHNGYDHHRIGNVRESHEEDSLDLIGHERIIKNELQVLDSEIEDLKSKLERAKQKESRSHRSIPDSVLLGEQF